MRPTSSIQDGCAGHRHPLSIPRRSSSPHPFRVPTATHNCLLFLTQRRIIKKTKLNSENMRRGRLVIQGRRGVGGTDKCTHQVCQHAHPPHRMLKGDHPQIAQHWTRAGGRLHGQRLEQCAVEWPTMHDCAVKRVSAGQAQGNEMALE